MEIELYSKLQNPIEAIDRIGEMFARSGMFNLDRIEQGKLLAMACLTERKSPIQILREYHVIEGRLCDPADSMLAKFRDRGGRHKIICRTPDRAEVELTTKDGETQRFSLTWDEVQKEPFVHGKDGFKKNWRTPRARMQTMWARVVSDGIRAMVPEIVAGIYTPEEIEDTVTIEAPKLTLPTAPQEKPANVRKAA